MKPKFTTWKLEADGRDITKLYGKYVSNIEVSYKVNSIPTATLQIISPSYLEDIFKVGMELKIFMGFDRNNIEMFTGKITALPAGSAESLIKLSVKLVDNSAKMAKIQKSRTFKIPKISAIVQQIAVENGYTPITDIDDDMIDISDLPIQIGQTDLSFLNELAQNSSCVNWFDGKYFYFCDDYKAHSTGDTFRTPDIYNMDITPIYKLAYRTDFIKNNIANIEWKFKQAAGSAPGTAAVKGFNEAGPSSDYKDHKRYFQGVTYRFKPEVLKELESRKGITKYWLLEWNAGMNIERQADFIKQYMKPVSSPGKIYKGKNYVASHKSMGMEATITLNQGDPSLRPPRTCSITDGTYNPQAHSSFLPDYLMSGIGTTKWYCNEVVTGLQNGMINTKLKVSR